MSNEEKNTSSSDWKIIPFLLDDTEKEEDPTIGIWDIDSIPGVSNPELVRQINESVQSTVQVQK